MTEVIEEAKRGHVLLNLILTNKEGLVRNRKVKGSLECSNHKIMEFRNLREGNQAERRITTLDFRKADFDLFRDMLGRVPCDTVLGRRWVQESWLFFKEFPPPSSRTVSPEKDIK